MERVISATEARVHFGKVMRRVFEDDETVIVERDGKPQMVLVSVEHYEEYKVLRQRGEPAWMSLMRQAHEAIERDLAGRTLPPAEEVIRQMREERDVHLNDLR